MAEEEEDGSGADVDGGGAEVGGALADEEDGGSNIEPEISDTKLIGSSPLCLVERRL
jgi:hypothetical protein